MVDRKYSQFDAAAALASGDQVVGLQAGKNVRILVSAIRAGLALDVDTVHRTGAESIDGAKTFSTQAAFNSGLRISTEQFLAWGASGGPTLAGGRSNSSGALILFATSAGTGPSVYLRPLGNLQTAGQLILNGDGSLTFADNTAKEKTRRDLGLPITISATAPASPQVGDVWIDIS